MLATISRPNIRLRAFFFVSLLALPLLLLPVSFSKWWDTQAPILPGLPLTSETLGKLPLSFEPNAGQADPSARFMAHASGGTLFFTPSEVVLALQGRSEDEEIVRTSTSATMMGATATDESALTGTPGSVVRMQFVGASGELAMQGAEQLPGRVNYFIGNDPSKWYSDLPTYGNITYSGLYSGIDLAYSGTGGQLKGTYTVAVGSDPSQIRWRYSGAEKVTVDQTGNLQITVATLANTNKGAQAVTVTEQAPMAWQEIVGTRIAVSARYLIAADQSIGFVLGSYDPNHPLIIDPTLTYSTYLGGSGTDIGWGIAVDTLGNAYVTGQTASTNFPLQNPFQPILSGSQDVFVTKFSATGSTLLYSTYLGGSGGDIGYGIAVDASGNAYVTGLTLSTNFPLQNPFQPTYGGGSYDAFVTKFSATGSTLLYSTYLGGGSQDEGEGIAMDTSGNASVTGYTSSTNFPLQNPFQPTRGGGYDVFVTKFSATGSTLIYSTYLGGSGADYGRGIAVDTSGNAYVTGQTDSTNFPLQNPFQPSHGGGITDAFVTKFSATGSTLLYSTYLGGSGLDYGSSIAVDTSGNASVTGGTSSTNFPLQNPFQPTYGGGSYDAFVTKFSATGSTLLYSTYLGGTGIDEGRGIAVDTSGNAYVTGYTASTNFPLQNPFQPTFGGGTWDAFVAKISDQSVSTPTVTPVLPSSTPVPPTATSAPPTATQASTSTTVPPTSTQPPATATASPEPCTITFTDVPEGSTFYNFIRCLACRGIISGYADGTFKPNNQVTRGQLAKIVSNAANFTEDPNPQIFEDVPPANTFYQWINRLARRGHMSGYACGGVGEPCTTGMPYFRPFANATRGQTSKIVSNAAGYSEIPTDQTFEDVPATHTFYMEIQRLATRNIMQGYPCGGVGEPCLSGKPYFRPANNVTRGQSAKIVANTFYPGCDTP